MDIDSLYFGVKIWDSEIGEMKTVNLFSSWRVMMSVALYVTKPKYIETYFDNGGSKLRFLFGDTNGRFEWEFGVCGLFGKESESKKIDVYEMYVVPNKDLLLKMVEEVSVNSAKKWLREHNYGKTKRKTA